MNVENIRFAIRALMEVPESGAFNMEFWGRHAGDHDPAEHNHCGTTACAGGWIALHPDAPELGLQHLWRADGSLTFRYHKTRMVTFSFGDEFSSLAAFLGITAFMSSKIFSAPNAHARYGHAARLEVIKKLEALLEGR